MDAKTLTCKDCGKDFEFSAGEQEFFAAKNFPEPVRCPDCRKTKKDNRSKK